MSGTNPVGVYTPNLNNATTNASAYKGDIDANFQVAQRVVDRFAPRPAASPNLTIVLDPGYIFDGVTLTEVVQQTSSAITMPSGANKRIDRAVVDRFTGVLTIVTGTPTGGTPAAPAIPAGAVPVAQIGTVTNPLLNTTTAITTNMIDDERDLSALGRGQLGELGGANTNNVVTNAMLAQAAAGTIKSNITGGTANESDNTLTAILDALLGSAQGDIIYRGASAWAVLTPGTAGQALVTGGASANPSWGSSGTGRLIKRTVLAAGASGTFTKQAATSTIWVQMWGAGGGSGTSATNGGNTTFDPTGANLIAGGGKSNADTSGPAGVPAGGVASGGDINWNGQNGAITNASALGMYGGTSGWGNPNATTETSVPTNQAGGGAGHPGGNSYNAAGGAYVDKFYTSPSSCAYAVGSAGTGTYNGGGGLLIIWEYS